MASQAQYLLVNKIQINLQKTIKKFLNYTVIKHGMSSWAGQMKNYKKVVKIQMSKKMRNKGVKLKGF